MAYSRPWFSADHIKILEVKEIANIHFRAGQYEQALEMYTGLINRYSKRPLLETVRLARCNRAACYLQLGEYQRCVDECNIVLFYVNRPAIMDKAKHRLAQATKALDDIDAEKRAIDPDYPGRPKYDIQERMKEQLYEASASSAKFSETQIEKHKPFGYMVRIKDPEPEYLPMRDMVPLSLTSEPLGGPELELYRASRDEFVRKIVTIHETELMQQHLWRCFSCGKFAMEWIHYPISDLTHALPLIMDYARPICEKGGNCEKVTRAAMQKAEKEDSEIAKELGVRIRM
ncbi:hypothetical protein C8R45DRAFT_1219202 [Mycena sanguinolenta]|nr:hypothetical protein C8R45DRAFT_1219202 [Mycena sanguinolenta]